MGSCDRNLGGRTPTHGLTKRYGTDRTRCDLGHKLPSISERTQTSNILCPKCNSIRSRRVRRAKKLAETSINIVCTESWLGTNTHPTIDFTRIGIDTVAFWIPEYEIVNDNGCKKTIPCVHIDDEGICAKAHKKIITQSDATNLIYEDSLGFRISFIDSVYFSGFVIECSKRTRTRLAFTNWMQLLVFLNHDLDASAFYHIVVLMN